MPASSFASNILLRVALFGTSADPPTRAHQMILHWLGQRYDQVAVWAANNPYKPDQLPLAHRLVMLRLVIEELEAIQAQIDVYETLSHEKSLISIQKAQGLFGPYCELTLVIGSDLITQIRQWYRVEEIFQQAQLLIIPRPDYPIRPEHLSALAPLGCRWAIADVKMPAISSTTYRNSHHHEEVTPAVQAYIQQEHLYP